MAGHKGEREPLEKLGTIGGFMANQRRAGMIKTLLGLGIAFVPIAEAPAASADVADALTAFAGDAGVVLARFFGGLLTLNGLLEMTTGKPHYLLPREKKSGPHKK